MASFNFKKVLNSWSRRRPKPPQNKLIELENGFVEYEDKRAFVEYKLPNSGEKHGKEL